MTTKISPYFVGTYINMARSYGQNLVDIALGPNSIVSFNLDPLWEDELVEALL